MKRMIDDELLTADIKGITVGKNLEVDGNVFTLNGKHWGIMPVYTTINNNTSERGFIIYSDRPGPYNPAPGVNQFYIKGIYADSYGDVSVLSVSTNKTDWYSVENDILYIKNQDAYNNFQKGTINLGIEKQNKLYRHILTLNAATEEGSPLVSIIEYLSTNNLKVDSLQGLTTLLQPTANYTYPINIVIDKDLGGIYQDYNCLEYSSNVWKFASSNSMTTKINITSVSDTVTAL